MELVGREKELDELIGAVAEEGPTLLAISGEPGIGKSRLLAELAARDSADHALVLSGRAAEFEVDLPFAVWVDALDGYLGRRGSQDIERLNGEEVAELSAILPGLRLSVGQPARPLDERHRVHAAMRSLLELIGAKRRVLLILDDLHWADEGSIDLVASLVRRPPDALVTIAMAFRNGQAPPKLTAALDRAEREGNLTWVIPRALGVEAMERMIGTGLPRHLREEVERESGGNPFFVESLSRSAATVGTVPPTVNDAVDEELRALDEIAREVLLAAATVGDQFDPDLVLAASELEEDAVLAGLDRLQRHDLVRPSSSGGRFTIRHPLVRRAVYERTGAGWRLAAHRRIADELESRGAGPSARAHHVALSARPGDDEAVDLLAEAARAVMTGAPVTGAAWLEAALGLISERDRDQRRVGLLMDLSRVRAAVGDMAGSREALLEALEDTPPEQVTQRLRLEIACANAERRMRQIDQSHDRLRALLDGLAPGPSAVRTELMLELAGQAFFAADGPALVKWAGSAMEDAEDPDDPGLQATALALQFAAQTVFGMPGMDPDLGDRADRAVHSLSDEQLAEHLIAAQYLTLGLMYAEQFRRVVEMSRRGIRVARLTRQEGLIPELTLSEGFCLTMLGRLAEAQRVLDAGVEAARVTGNPSAISWVLMNLSVAQLSAGRAEDALRTARESFDIAANDDPNLLRPFPAYTVAAARFALGEAEPARDLLLAECGGPGLEMVPGFWRCNVLELLTRIELALGHENEAEAAATACEIQADAVDRPAARGWALLARAAVELEREDDRAADTAEAAAESFAGSDAVVDRARALVLAGRARVASGRRDAALESLDTAAGLAEEHGAEAVREEAVRELRRLGRRRARPEGDGPGSLSDRERDVAELIQAGRTNAEIAGELFLSVKTVESHVRNMFRKLDVKSRAEIARMMENENE